MAERSHICCPDELNCGSSDATSYNTEKETGFCNSCELGFSVFQGKIYGKYRRGGKQRAICDVDDWLDRLEESGENFMGTSQGVVDDDPFNVGEPTTKTKSTSSKGTGEYRPMRGIKMATMQKYGAKVYTDAEWYERKTQESGTSDEIQFVYPSGVKKLRRLDLPKEHKAHFSVSGGSVHELFGQNLFPAGCSKMVTIVEGEFDALAAYQMLSGGSYENPVVSLPSATPSGKLWKSCEKWLDSFDKIVVSVDSDGKAYGAVEALFDLFPQKVFIMNHGEHKDANEFLEAGAAAEYKRAWWAARKFSPVGFTSSKEDWLNAVSEEDPYDYTETPITGLNKIGRGLVKGGITIVKAPPGVGKSSLLRMFMHDLVVDKGKPVAALMMEEMKSTTGRAMATYELGANVNTREDAENSGYTEDQVKEALSNVVKDEKFISFDINPQDPVEDCLRQCKHAVTIYGVEYIFIDHLQRLAYLAGTESATGALTELGVKLTEFAKRKGIGIICISHVNADGRTKYASAIEEEAIVVMELARDKQAENPDERNTTAIVYSKNRPYAKTGPAGFVTYDEETTMVSEKLSVFDGIPVMDRKHMEDPFDVG